MNISNISILLGAGFSVPAGYPIASQLGQELLSVSEDDYHFFTDLTLLEGSNPLGNFKDDPWVYLVKSISLYQKYRTTDFNYEDFYDYLVKMAFYGSNRFLNSLYGLNAPNDKKVYFGTKMLEVFQLLLRKKLLRECKDTTPYDSFLNLLSNKNFAVKLHSLNHDLLIEHLLDIRDVRYSDGFTTINSPYFYQPCGKTEKEVLPVFCGYNDTELCLYKLHGSLNYYRTSVPVNNSNEYAFDKLIQCNYDMHGECYMLDNDGDFYRLPTNPTPEFLTGTKSKIKQYIKPYYCQQLEYFKRNLTQSDVLIIIGYGFKDSEINKIIKKNLRKESPILVFDLKLKRDEVIDLLKIGHRNPLQVLTGTTVVDVSAERIDEELNKF